MERAVAFFQGNPGRLAQPLHQQGHGSHQVALFHQRFDDKLERLKAGAEASKSLAGPSGNSEGAVTLESLAELADTDPTAFDKAWEKAAQKGLLG